MVSLGDGWQESGRSKASLACSQNDPTTDQPTSRLTHQSTPLTNKRRQWRTRAEHRRLKSEPPLMRGLDIHKNIPVSLTKLTLRLRVGFISSYSTADKLIPVNPKAITCPPKMSLLLKGKSMPALIIKPRPSALVWCMYNICWTTSVSRPPSAANGDPRYLNQSTFSNGLSFSRTSVRPKLRYMEHLGACRQQYLNKKWAKMANLVIKS